MANELEIKDIPENFQGSEDYHTICEIKYCQNEVDQIIKVDNTHYFLCTACFKEYLRMIGKY